MNAFKSPVARLAHLFQQSRDAWKAKALERQQRLRAAQVKIRDLENSRGNSGDSLLNSDRVGDLTVFDIGATSTG
jgi:hypothetical protein